MNRRLPPLEPHELPALIESILFVAEEPVELPLLAQALRHPVEDVEAALAVLQERCLQGGTRLQRTGELLQLVTAPDAGPYIERFLGLESRQRLSGAALESLAIIAYKQPMTRAGVEQVRGVNSDGAIASLIARGLIEEVGRAPGPGRPALLGTTMKFLEHFGLSKPDDLPPLLAQGGLSLQDEDDEDTAATFDAPDAEDAADEAEDPQGDQDEPSTTTELPPP
jgi:segregation and condensation protein B